MVNIDLAAARKAAEETAQRAASRTNAARVADEAVSSAASSGAGPLRSAAETAWKAATEIPRRALKGVAGVGAAISKNKLGAFLLTGTAMIVAGTGIKSWADRREQRREQEALAAMPEAADLRQNILANRAKLEQVSQELGQFNPKGNFRETVRSGGMAQQGGGQPEPF
jgi:hypothetical protein